MDKTIKLNAPGTISTNTIRHHGEDIKIKEFLTFEEMLSMVNNCVEGSFDIDGEYFPELTDFYIKKETIDIYTNVDLGVDPIETYALIYQTDIFEVVVNEINRVQFEEIKRAIDRKIVHLLRTNEKAHNKEFEDMTTLFQTVGKRFESTFKDLNLDELSKALDKISNEDSER